MRRVLDRVIERQSDKGHSSSFALLELLTPIIGGKLATPSGLKSLNSQKLLLDILRHPMSYCDLDTVAINASSR